MEAKGTSLPAQASRRLLFGVGAVLVMAVLSTLLYAGALHPITFITRLCLDAALYEPATPRRRGRKDSFASGASDFRISPSWPRIPDAGWEPLTITVWYSGEERILEVVSETAVWHSTGLPALPLRWVLIRDPRE